MTKGQASQYIVTGTVNKYHHTHERTKHTMAKKEGKNIRSESEEGIRLFLGSFLDQFNSC